MTATDFTPEQARKLADIEAAAPAPESFDATAALRRVVALADELEASTYDSGTDHGYGYSDGLMEAADRIRAAIRGDV